MPELLTADSLVEAVLASDERDLSDALAGLAPDAALQIIEAGEWPTEDHFRAYDLIHAVHVFGRAW